MRPDLLHVVTCIFNPMQWKSRIAHYKKFRDHMLESGVNLTVVECAFGDRPYELTDEPDCVNVVRVRSRSLAWTKENLINVGVSRLQEDAKYIAWIDADVKFHNTNWASDAVHALQHHQVVQLWSTALDLGPDGEPMVIKGRPIQTSFGKVWNELGNIEDWMKHSDGGYSYPHPGYAWAITRDAYDNIGGLLEISGLGSADHQMAWSFINRVNHSVHGQTHESYQDAVRLWGERASDVIKGNVGFVKGLLEHWFHGSKDKRKYIERWDVLVNHAFNPHTDLRKNAHGVIELVGNKPDMERDIYRYFKQRDEDSNAI